MSKFFFASCQAILLWILILLGLCGCGVKPLLEGRIQPPRVSLAGLTILPPATGCWPLSVQLRLQNPNPEPLQLLGYDYVLRLNGQLLVEGESQSRVTLPAQGETILEVPLLVNLEGMPKLLIQVFQQAAVPYELTGGLRLASVLGGLRLPFRFQGDLSQEQGWQYLQDYLKF